MVRWRINAMMAKPINALEMLYIIFNEPVLNNNRYLTFILTSKKLATGMINDFQRRIHYVTR